VVCDVCSCNVISESVLSQNLEFITTVFQSAGLSLVGLCVSRWQVVKKWNWKVFFFPTMAQQPPLCQGVLIIEDSWLHPVAPHSVGLLASDHPGAETSRQHTTPTRDRHPCPRRDSNPQSQEASGRRLTSQTARAVASANWKVTEPNYVTIGTVLIYVRGRCYWRTDFVGVKFVAYASIVFGTSHRLWFLS